MKRLGIGLALAALLASPAQATCNATNCQNVAVDFLYILTDNADVRIKILDDITPLNCSPVGGNYLVLKGSSANREEIYSALMVAAATGKLLRYIRIVENSSDCEVYYIGF